MTPHLCHAWLELGFAWLPLEWIGALTGNDNYIEACKCSAAALRIRKAIEATLDMATRSIDGMRESNNSYLRVLTDRQQEVTEDGSDHQE